MEEDYFIKTLNMLYEFKQTITEVEIDKEIERITKTSDTDLYLYIIKVHFGEPKSFMNLNKYKRLNSTQYKRLIPHDIYDDMLLNIGYKTALVLNVRPHSTLQISFDIFNYDYSDSSSMSKLRLFITLCTLSYLALPWDRLRVANIKYQIQHDVYFGAYASCVLNKYISSRDIEFFYVANALTTKTNKPQFYDLICKMHSSYKTNRFYDECYQAPNLFELCSYDRTPDDGYDIKCFNRSYQLSSNTEFTYVDYEDMDIDRAFAYIGGIYGNVGNDVYTQLLIDFHKHIYEKEIDVEILHKLIMVDEELTPLERRFAIMFHRSIIKHYILSGGIGKQNEANSVVFKDIIPNIEHRGIITYTQYPLHMINQ